MLPKRIVAYGEIGFMSTGQVPHLLDVAETVENVALFHPAHVDFSSRNIAAKLLSAKIAKN